MNDNIKKFAAEPFITNARDEAVNKLKLTSKNYKRWQEALRLRDAVIRNNGYGTKEFDDAYKVIRYWSAKWKDEMSNLDARLDNHQLSNKVQDMLDEIELLEAKAR